MLSQCRILGGSFVGAVSPPSPPFTGILLKATFLPTEKKNVLPVYSWVYGSGAQQRNENSTARFGSHQFTEAMTAAKRPDKIAQGIR